MKDIKFKEHTAEKMKNQLIKNFPLLKIGDSVALNVPKKIIIIISESLVILRYAICESMFAGEGFQKYTC